MEPENVKMLGSAAAVAVVLFLLERLERLLDKPRLSRPEGLTARALRVGLIALLTATSVAVVLAYGFALFVVPYVLIFSDAAFDPDQPQAESWFIVSVFVIVFLLAAHLWVRIFHQLPVLMHLVTFVVFRNDDVAQFPKAVDYLYLTLGAVGIAFAFLEVMERAPSGPGGRLTYLLMLTLAISLRLAKVTIERRAPDYLDPTVLIRSTSGRALIRRRV